MLKLTCLSFGNKNKFICSSDFLFFHVILFMHFLSIVCIVARNIIEKGWNFSVVCWLHQTPENVSCCCHGIFSRALCHTQKVESSRVKNKSLPVMDTFGVGSQLREATSSLFAVQYI